MRILHTSDWHLGRSFHREDLLAAQRAFVDHLEATVRDEGVDVLLVSGDLYDRALPPVDAVRLCNEALGRLSAHARIVLIAGNHDSAHRLGFGASLMDAGGVHLRTDPATVGEPVLIDGTAFYPIPYLEPELVRDPWELAERSHAAALGAAMDRVRADLAARPAGTRSVVLAHAFVTGGAPSDSERDISVGGSAHVPASVFDGVDYAALGHLHGKWAVTPRVRYSGSPIAYSFSEEHHVKGYWLIDLRDDGTLDDRFVEAPVPRPLARLRGRLDDLLDDEAHEELVGHWLQITLTDPQRPANPMERLRARFPHALVLNFEPDRDGAADDRTWSDRVRGRSELEVAGDFVTEMTLAPATATELALLREAFEECRDKEVS
ncbi:exonuclease SbcCD subunit D [Actinomadura parmotrematis]|uniref:Nuclease SbcCD subunit D n=1 Tax=Actinomadura parmotrematis TaxID=2864039 RepID=A0ABS7G239_9ACTN|nr:exonuclease SbcCD subunit D [Actinomadura parmotrematis]MBW8486786.1 exonuclease SbcCD subunit D [Actinomadura parmotrematis]